MISENDKAGAGRALKPGGRRSAARLFAIQALYQIAVTGIDPDAAIVEFLEERIEEAGARADVAEPDLPFFTTLVRGISAESDDLDNIVAAVLDPGWPLERLELLLRLLLKAGAYELTALPDVPPAAVISEYVDLAHAFFDGKQPGMVNGLLDRLARDLRAEAFAVEEAAKDDLSADNAVPSDEFQSDGKG